MKSMSPVKERCCMASSSIVSILSRRLPGVTEGSLAEEYHGPMKS